MAIGSGIPLTVMFNLIALQMFILGIPEIGPSCLALTGRFGLARRRGSAIHEAANCLSLIRLEKPFSRPNCRDLHTVVRNIWG